MMSELGSLFDLDQEAWEALLPGEPAFRRAQIWEGLYSQHRLLGELTTLPKTLRAQLEDLVQPGLRGVVESVSDGGETVKFLWELHDGARIETVLMHYRDRSTVCVSSQAGCAMACSFCATGQAGFSRHLSAGEIVEQVVRAQRRAAGIESGAAHTPDVSRRVSNVVFMGMGEPLANFDATIRAAHTIRDHLGIGARHITISTVGLVPGIRRITNEDLQVGLAVSLHAANDSKRDTLVPINRRYPIADLMDACADYVSTTGRRVSFEWALIDGVNDSAQDALELAALARILGAHVNLIPLNATPGYPTRGSSPEVVDAFRSQLVNAGVNATVRDTRGSDIDAACGQLHANEVRIRPRRSRAS